jgi:transposase InsO family protein
MDEASHCVAAIPVKSKAEIPRKLKELLMYWQRRLKLQIKYIRSDRGTEFINQEFRSFCLAQGIEMETSVPGTPQQNGAAKRMNRTLKERVRNIASSSTSQTVSMEGGPSSSSHPVQHCASQQQERHAI